MGGWAVAGVNVTACLVTRGDVDMRPILDPLPEEWEVRIWDNGANQVTERARTPSGQMILGRDAPDLSVYGRYAAIEYATHDLIYVQDDDVIVSDPEAIVDAWVEASHDPTGGGAWDYVDHVVCNMPLEFRPHYPDSGLVGFGAAFHRDAPRRAFDRFDAHSRGGLVSSFFFRRCDNVFTTLTPIVKVDVPKEDREFASAPNRMWKQPEHVGERDGMIELAREVRDS